MKRALLLTIAASISSLVFADLNGPGYYRVENYRSKRYVSVIDNRGRIDYMNTTADLQAIRLQKNFDVVCSDPATILYFTPAGSNYQIDAQGTGIHQIIGHYLGIRQAGTADGQKLYNAYGEMNGVVKYLGDANFILSDDFGDMITYAKGDYIKWYITPVSADSDNYFGVEPSYEVDGKYYTTMYASFPFSPYSEGIKAYYVKGMYSGNVLLEEITGVVPAATPVVIECATDAPTTNRLNIGGTANAISGNLLKGQYFNSSVEGHINRLAYDKDTMRVLGVCKDGSLGFVKDETLDYIPANKCYITVTAGSPDEYKIVPKEEYEAGVDDIISEGDSSESPADVYNLNGICVLRNALPADLNSLPAGIYISNGKKIVIR